MQARWSSITAPQFPWKRETLDCLPERLPDGDRWRAWSNFDFIDDEDRVSRRVFPDQGVGSTCHPDCTDVDAVQ
ncbi:MAG: hypothetical protein EA400_03155 [Chromatiaceae bacterium]|nr:MAG: hypothetical protein EA400_03155 [Chromatiaceae bacterium]